MMRKKTSPIWLMDKEEFKELIKKHKTYTSILKEFGYSGKGGSSITLRQRIAEENIDCSHIPRYNTNRKFPDRKSISLEEVTIKNSTYDRGNLKKRLLKDGILENKCDICDLEPVWQNKNLVMVLDHINGVNNDHRLRNLRLLCPNCNSQTSTFAGKTFKKKYNCKKCGIGIIKKSKLCCKCYSFRQRKVKDRPSKEQLLKEIEETNYCAVGRKYGVSDNAVRKWVK